VVSKEVQRERDRARYRRDREKKLASGRIYYKKNAERVKARTKAYRVNNTERIRVYKKTYYQTLSEKMKERIREINSVSHKKYRVANKQSIAEQRRMRRLGNPSVRLCHNLHTRCQQAIKFALAKKSRGTWKLIGCTPGFLIEHLESKFLPGMSWENYGKAWHVDHIRPCASFNLEDPEQQEACFNFLNLQPLWKHENFSKSSFFGGEKHYFVKGEAKAEPTPQKFLAASN
jgi:hypothetical protein